MEQHFNWMGLLDVFGIMLMVLGPIVLFAFVEWVIERLSR